MTDPKQGEREYFARIGEAGRQHALGKPFRDPLCAQYLVNLAALFALMRPPPGRIVEFGCGTGWLSLILAERGYDVTGVDISPDAIALAQRLQSERGLANAAFQIADYESFQLAAPADCVVFHDALHHAESLPAALTAAHAALAPGGMLLCIEPGRGHSRSESSRRAVAEFGVHENDMPPRTIIRCARQVGFVRHVVLPWPWFYWHAMYRSGYSRATSPANLVGRRLLSVWRIVQALFRSRAQGMVVLWKA
jgi:SAM-dependent methyltransferase